MKKKKSAWKWWALALGEKASKCDRESDKVAIIRTFIFATYLITNIAIVANAVRHWNRKTEVHVYVDSAGIPSYVIPPERKVNKPLEFE